MKTRYKILIVIVCFVIFYLALIPILQVCHISESDCIIWRELMLLTRPVISSSEGLEWSGTVDGIEESTVSEQIMQNVSFTVSMIVLPLVIIGFIVIGDRQKRK